MAKLFKTSDDIFEEINKVWSETDCSQIGVRLKVISTQKAKQILKLSKASATTEYLIREQDVLTLVVYEEAWDRLNDEAKQLLLNGVFSVVYYDTEKEHLILDNTPYADLFNMRHAKDSKGEEYLDRYDNALEASSLVISQIEDEEKKKKEEEKERKAEERALKRAAKNK
jgi:hypothetical protein